MNIYMAAALTRAAGTAAVLGACMLATGSSQQQKGKFSPDQNTRQLKEDVNKFGGIPALPESKFGSIKFSTEDKASMSTLTAWIDQVKQSHKALEGTQGDGPLWQQMYGYHTEKDDTSSDSAKFAAKAVTQNLGNTAKEVTADDLIIYGKSLTGNEQRLFIDFLDGASQDLRRAQQRAQATPSLEQANVYLVKTELMLAAIMHGRTREPMGLVASTCVATLPFLARYDVNFVIAQSTDPLTPLTAEQTRNYRVRYRFSFYNTSSEAERWNLGQATGKMPPGLFDVWLETGQDDGSVPRKGPTVREVSPATLGAPLTLVVPT